MEKVTKNNEGSVERQSTLSKASHFVDYYVGDLLGIAWKMALFYAAWIAASYFWMTTAATPAGSQISAIAFWFAWLFLGATIALGVVVAIMGMLDRARLSQSKRKY